MFLLLVNRVPSYLNCLKLTGWDTILFLFFFLAKNSYPSVGGVSHYLLYFTFSSKLLVDLRKWNGQHRLHTAKVGFQGSQSQSSLKVITYLNWQRATLPMSNCHQITNNFVNQGPALLEYESNAPQQWTIPHSHNFQNLSKILILAQELVQSSTLRMEPQVFLLNLQFNYQLNQG